MKKIYQIAMAILCMSITNMYMAQSSDFDYQVQYNLVDVDYTGGDTIFSAECMLSLNISDLNVKSIEISIGTSDSLSNVKQLIVPYSDGAEMSLFNGNSKAMIHLGNLDSIRYFYKVRLIYQDDSYSDYIEQNSVAN